MTFAGYCRYNTYTTDGTFIRRSTREKLPDIKISLKCNFEKYIYILYNTYIHYRYVFLHVEFIHATNETHKRISLLFKIK